MKHSEGECQCTECCACRLLERYIKKNMELREQNRDLREVITRMEGSK